jgi:ComF family protein
MSVPKAHFIEMRLIQIRQIGRSFIDFIYPPLCLHCGSCLIQSTYLLCPTCVNLLELIEPSSRCLFCFSEKDEEKLHVCLECRTRPSFLDGAAASFDFLGPASTLIKKMKYSHMPYLDKAIAAYMIAQFCKLDWPLPDVIIPVPIAFTHLFNRGYNQSALIAKSIGALLDRSYSEVLQRKSGDHSQAALGREKRMTLSKTSFICKPVYPLQDKNILLVDDVMTTGTTLRCCAEVLQAHYPKSIYALVFCRALK